MNENEELLVNVNKNSGAEINRKYKSTRNYKLVIILLLLVSVFSIGYGYLSSNLKIFGGAGIPAMSWDIHFEDAVEDEDNNIFPIQNASILESKTRIDFDVLLEKPLDKYGFEVDMVNSGSIDSKIETITLYGLSEEEAKYIEYKACA